ncbi:hypothetical protein SAMN05428977_104625 [Nitrosomonas sp. Nm166]|nr:hypothetical protein SAMN05428977_104625 [Nitrosomonas sp. Nm166]
MNFLFFGGSVLEEFLSEDEFSEEVVLPEEIFLENFRSEGVVSWGLSE